MFRYTANPERQVHLWGPLPEDEPPAETPIEVPEEEESQEEEEEEALPA